MSLNWVTERPASAVLRCEQDRDPKRVLVLLGSVVISEALSNLLRTCGYDCCSGNQTVADPDLIIADGATLEGDLLRPYAKARVLLLETQPESGRMARTFLSHTLHGIISCTTDLQKFKRALVAVIEGRVWVDDPSIQSFLLDAGLISKRGRIMGFTPQEKKIAEHICDGDTNEEIALKLGISAHTVKSHMRNIMRKSGAVNRSHLASLVSNKSPCAGDNDDE